MKILNNVAKSKLYGVRNEIMLSKIDFKYNVSYIFFSHYSCKRVQQKYKQYYLRGSMSREAKAAWIRFKKGFKVKYW